MVFCRNTKLPVQRVQHRLKKLHPYCFSNIGGVSHDKIPEECCCIVRFISEDHLIAELAEEREEEDDE